MLEKSYDYFKSNIKDLLVKYSGEYIVIKEEKIIGHYKSFDEAYRETSIKEEIGTFIIQHCVVEDREKAMHFAWNNVSFEEAVKQ